MDESDFGGWLFGGDTGGATTSIVGGNYIPDFGGNVGASGFFEPTAFATDFGAFSNFTNEFNNYVATQTPTLFMAYDTTIPPSPVLNELRNELPAILAQQDQIKTLATSLNNVTGKLQQDYTNYTNVYNQNIKPYNDAMATYKQYIRYRDQTIPGSYLYNRHNSNANQKLNEANTYVKTINDAASKYETDYKTYQTEVKALEDSVNTYKDTFNTFKNKADTVPKTIPTPEPEIEPPTVPNTTETPDTTGGTTGTTGGTTTGTDTTGVASGTDTTTDTTGTGTTGTVTTSGDVDTTGTTGTTTDTTGTTGTTDTTVTPPTDQEIIDLITNPPITTPVTTPPVTTPVTVPNATDTTTTPVTTPVTTPTTTDTSTTTVPLTTDTSTTTVPTINTDKDILDLINRPKIPPTTDPTAEPITVKPPPDVKPPTTDPTVEPITVNPPPDDELPDDEVPVDEVPPVDDKEKPPTKTVKDSPSVNVRILDIPNRRNLPTNRALASSLNLNTNVGTVLGTGLATRPDISSTSEPYLLESDNKKRRDVWNTESLRGALGI